MSAFQQAMLQAEDVAKYILGGLVSVSVLMLTRFLNSADAKKKKEDERFNAHDKMLNDLREEVGKFKMVNEAQWKHIDELKEKAEKLTERYYELRK